MPSAVGQKLLMVKASLVVVLEGMGQYRAGMQDSSFQIWKENRF